MLRIDGKTPIRRDFRLIYMEDLFFEFIYAGKVRVISGFEVLEVFHKEFRGRRRTMGMAR